VYTALTEGYLAGGALDVTEPEPISPDDPLLKLDNIIATAHSAQFSIPAYLELMRRPGEEIARVFKGERPIDVFNL
jgi:D-3-phosphoglycerate dehydrogenase